MTASEKLIQELRQVSGVIGETTDLEALRALFARANALWARINRLHSDPPDVA